MWYILDEDKNPVPVEVNSDEYKSFTEDLNRKIVEQTQVTDDIWVSTVFLLLDHGFGSGKPVLFETMVFRNSKGCEMERYCTWTEAKEGHAKMLREIIKEINA